MLATPLKRRGFLAAIGFAPIAAPVMAKEAAAKMGMGIRLNDGPIGIPTISGGSFDQDQTSWLKKHLMRFDTEAGRRELDEQVRYVARTLDPDLASMRSVSPAFAYAQQRHRCMKRLDAERRWNVTNQIAEAAQRSIGL
jgi:hypothetical protein